MDEEEEDIHMCLVCNQTIRGLENYVHHKKHECKKPQKKQEPPDALRFPETSGHPSLRSSNFYLSQPFSVSESGFPDGALKGTFLHEPVMDVHNVNNVYPCLSTTALNVHTDPETMVSQMNISVYTNTASTCAVSPNFDLSPILSTTIHDSSKTIGVGLHDSLHQDHGILSPVMPETTLPSSIPYGSELSLSKKEGNSEKEAIDDFFQSLELISKSDLKSDKSGHFNQLPISNILNNLNFSSDEETIGFNFGDDVSFDSLTDSGDDREPSRSYTGGKWRDGEKPSIYKKHRCACNRFLEKLL